MKMERVLNLLNRDMTINCFIGTIFGLMVSRTMEQQETIERLEAEKASLVKANKGMIKTIWEWKQTLYAEAESNPQSALVPLSTLKFIYGEAAAPAISGGDDKQDKKSAPKLMV